ncbi:jg11879 [Pararge aegeria aegeria]|uniref:Jg11879 protein n=1 Tax=Pararge aegeria aegeria TaxID=348720 RepID=A0A8S4SEG7_9NEOP|nr:jg11879 [Pararge aegeria aegeria]
MGLIRRLRVTQRAMERARELCYEEIRRRTRVTDIAQRVAKLKWQWAGYIARWTDDIRRVAGSRWRQAAQDRALWNSLQKTYVQQWTSIG